MNIFILTHYPDIHSDEAWLSGLTRAWMSTGDLTVTEPFFDLLPRAPHAVKALFHGVQALFFAVGGYGIFQARLVSLLAGCAALLLADRLLRRLLPGDRPDRLSFLFMVMISLDPQFAAAAHLGRQEIHLLLLLLLALLALFPARPAPPFRRGARAGLAMAAAIGFHPAAFLVAAAAAGAIPVSAILAGEGRSGMLRAAGGFLAVCAAGALLAAGASLAMNPGFPGDYLAFGESVEVTVPFYLKMIRFPDYYQKLWYRHSGTYFIPDMRPLLILHPLALAGTLALALRDGIAKQWKRAALLCLPLCMAAGFNAAFLLLGKFAPPLFVLQLPALYLAAALLFSRAGEKLRRALRFFLPAAAALLLAVNIGPFLRQGRESYRDYGRSIQALLELDGSGGEQQPKVLGNLNAEYHLPFGALLDFRNLAFLEEAGLDFTAYVRSRGITHILYPEEMDFIHRRRPVWNILYGNVTAYYDDMSSFLEEQCAVVGSFESPVYGMRIISYSGKKGWKVTLYRVEDAPSRP